MPTDSSTGSVCAVVVTYNRRDLLHECLTALESQERPVDRILVIDNDSSDGTPEMVREEHPATELVRLPENVGGAGGFREGVRRAYEAGFDWLWLMDDDTIATATALEELLRVPAELDGLPEPLVLASKVIMPDGELHPFNRPRPDERHPERTIAAVEKGLLPIRYTSFVSALIHREGVTELGLPIGDFFIWLDDVEFTARIIKGHAGYLAPRSVVVHKSHTNATVYAGERYYYAIRNMLWLLRGRSLRGDRSVRARLWLSLLEGIPAHLAINRFKPTAFRTVARGVADGLRKIPA
jgi:rhamnopyranosyl-N-acetylglucosaminyl-diphospho-decaprenol beta-1,3/1,4-galactofuranosyltransferase